MKNVLNYLVKQDVSFSLVNQFGTYQMRLFRPGTAISVDMDIPKPLSGDIDVLDYMELLVGNANTVLGAGAFERWEHDFNTKKEAREAYSDAKSAANTLLTLFGGDLQDLTNALYRDFNGD